MWGSEVYSTVILALLLINYEEEKEIKNLEEISDKIAERLYYFAIFFILYGIITGVLQQFMKIPWGKFQKENSFFLFSFTVCHKIGWVLQESPSAIIAILVLVYSSFCHQEIIQASLLIMFIVHYVNRAFIYAYFTNKFASSLNGVAHERQIPVIICISGFIFTVMNGLLQSVSLAYIQNFVEEKQAIIHVLSFLYNTGVYKYNNFFTNIDEENEKLEYFTNTTKFNFYFMIVFIRFTGGILMFFIGMYINIKSDYDLSKSKRYSKIEVEEQEMIESINNYDCEEKKAHENKKIHKKTIDKIAKKSVYTLPRGGWFEYVSCANYFGEIIEWLGFALACNSLHAYSFAIFSFLFLLFRGIQQHKFYKSKFFYYPYKRKAVIPFIY